MRRPSPGARFAMAAAFPRLWAPPKRPDTHPGSHRGVGKERASPQPHATGNGEGDEEEEEEEERVAAAEASLLNKLLRTALVESNHRVEILQQDPTSPLFSVKSFEELPLKKELLKGIYMMGFNRPSKIQETALPIMLAYPPQNLIAQSQSGTGKTAAFVLAMLSRVSAAEKHPQCLCLAPTYELALQIGHVVETIGRFCPDLRVTYAVRGNRVPRGTVLEEQLVIGTPGTVLDWCFKWKFLDIKKIKLFVLDEADIMIDTQGLACQSIRVQRALPQGCQMLLFSATFKETVRAFAIQIISNPIVIKLREDELTLANIRQFYFICQGREEKYRALCNIYGGITIGQAIIFCQTRRSAQWLAMMMNDDGHQVGVLTAELSVSQRADIIQRFRDGKEKVLIATNVCARGIDVQQVTIVVNFQLPTTSRNKPDFETYLHRIGRTGRFGKDGIAFSMVEKHSIPLIQMIEEHFRIFSAFTLPSPEPVAHPWLWESRSHQGPFRAQTHHHSSTSRGFSEEDTWGFFPNPSEFLKEKKVLESFLHGRKPLPCLILILGVAESSWPSLNFSFILYI
ncbi:ATP-dependent RNA helicase DDX25 isoform X1 [Calypte anna]|uniref:ATP-dependent RNA helicase DDX25 isoform X1 n=1 Tax=Calypte anna TaxID=9244 RepID=UPI0011C47AC0|nr:ATP-dependent RNA helicase DDX25 isoform X1 [Calypte anna]